MARLIEVHNAQALASTLTLNVGDVLVFKVSGGHVNSGTDVVHILGPFFPGLMLDNGEIMSPMGAPNTVMFLAHRPGRAQIDIVTGDPWFSATSKALEVVINP